MPVSRVSRNKSYTHARALQELCQVCCRLLRAMQEPCQLQPHAHVCKNCALARVVPSPELCKSHALASPMPTRFPRSRSVCKKHALASSVPSHTRSLAAVYAHLCATKRLSSGVCCPILSYYALSARSCT